MPRDFVLWMNGAIKVLGDRAPTPEEWEQIRQAHAETVGQMIAEKMNPDTGYETYLKILADYNRQINGYRGALTSGSLGNLTFAATTAQAVSAATPSHQWTDSSCSGTDPCCGGNCS